MKKYDQGRRGALLAMVIFLVLAAVFFALGIAFFRAVGGVFFALWLFFLLGAISSAIRAFCPDKAKKHVEEKEKKPDPIEELLFYDTADDDF